MWTHQYAADGDGNIHVFHSHDGRDEWVSNGRREAPADRGRGRRTVTRREAENAVGRETLRRLSRRRHELHVVIEKTENEGSGAGSTDAGSEGSLDRVS